MTKGFLRIAFLAIIVFVTACGPLQSSTDRGEPVEIRVAFGAEMLMTDLPQILAHELLAKEGYEVTTTFYSKPELAVEALARGDADIGEGSVPAYWTAISKGANVASIMEQTANEWQIVAVPDIQTCADLDGMRLAHHSESSVSKAMADAYIAESCPGTEPQILFIANSPNRAAAMLADEIDATPLKLEQAMQLEREAPDRFHILTNFAQDVPGLKTVLLQVNRDFADQHPEAVRDFIRAMLTVHRQIDEDPKMLMDEVSKRLEVDPDLLPEITQAYRDINTWDVNGGLTEASVKYSLDFYTNAGELEPGLTVSDVADLSFLEAVLDEIGHE
jgi:ABC-type nitrate/sulfonate/bicarbonate transport system substrate-binding protein